jgi:hypothetical protein
MGAWPLYFVGCFLILIGVIFVIFHKKPIIYKYIGFGGVNANSFLHDRTIYKISGEKRAILWAFILGLFFIIVGIVFLLIALFY